MIGVQAWSTYEAREGEAPRFHEVDDQDDDAQFMVPAVVYLLELPFRILEAPVVAYLGTEELYGREVDRVFASWSEEPNRRNDQFILWIDRETKLLTMAEYTVRDQLRFARGTSTFTRYMRTGGLVVPGRMAVNVRPRENHEHTYTHRMVLWNWRFDDEVERAAVWPDRDRGSSGAVSYTHLTLPTMLLV